MNYKELSLKLHEKFKGKLEIASKVPINNKDDLSTAYTPGVAEPCLHIAKNKEDIYKYTSKGNMVAVITDGSAVLGLGNIGAEEALPVMEGKAILFKRFAGLDAFPICINTQDTKDIILVDSKGIISRNRKDLNKEKKEVLKITNRNNLYGSLADAVKGRDVFIGLSSKNVLSTGMVKTMTQPIIFAMANPDPEILPEQAKARSEER